MSIFVKHNLAKYVTCNDVINMRVKVFVIIYPRAKFELPIIYG